MRTERDQWLDVALIGAATLGAALAVLGGPQLLRTPIIGLLLLAGPGLALARAVGLHDALLTTVVAIGGSLSVATGIATVQLYAEAWRPELAVLLVATMTVGLCLVSLSRRRAPADEQEVTRA